MLWYFKFHKKKHVCGDKFEFEYATFTVNRAKFALKRTKFALNRALLAIEQYL